MRTVRAAAHLVYHRECRRQGAKRSPHPDPNPDPNPDSDLKQSCGCQDRMRANSDVYIRGHLGLFNVVIFAISLLVNPLLVLVQCALWGFILAEFMG